MDFVMSDGRNHVRRPLKKTSRHDNPVIGLEIQIGRGVAVFGDFLNIHFVSDFSPNLLADNLHFGRICDFGKSAGQRDGFKNGHSAIDWKRPGLSDLAKDVNAAEVILPVPIAVPPPEVTSNHVTLAPLVFTTPRLVASVT